MSKQNFVERTFKDGGILDQHLPNYTYRPQQYDLSKRIDEAIEKGTSLLAEAPTGVGKSLAALVPAFDYIATTGKPVVVVTSSIVLQEQYISKDIPMLESMYNLQVNPVLIKGRSNYLCPYKHRNVAKKGLSANERVDTEEMDQVMGWAANTQTGDKSELSFVPSYPVWDKVACIDSNDCTGKRCPLYDSCFYYKERRKTGMSRLIVCNYHYFYTSITSPDAKMLPDDMELIIMDEGHEVTAIARDFQEKKYSEYVLKNIMNRFLKEAQFAMTDASIGDDVESFLLSLESDDLNDALTEMTVALDHEFKRAVTEKTFRDFMPLTPRNRRDFAPFADNHIKQLSFASKICTKYTEHYGMSSLEDLPVVEDYYGEETAHWLLKVMLFQNQLLEVKELLEYIFMYEGSTGNPDDIFWLAKQKDVISIHAKPVTAKRLIQPFFEEGSPFTAVVMSATLSTNQSFDHLEKDFGIDEQGYKADHFIASSPFNLEENILWYLPNTVPNGNEPGHINSCLEEMFQVVKAFDGRTLCLFTSKKNLELAEKFFSQRVPKHIKIYSQNMMPRQQLIEKMRAEDHVLLLGTRSLFTGIDIQGHHLSAVLIDKLPFPMLGDPINDYLMNQARGFQKFSLPEAIISLKQGFGRLNRTASDRGVIGVMDNRLATAKYKGVILNSFEFKINATRNIEDVKRYANETVGKILF